MSAFVYNKETPTVRKRRGFSLLIKKPPLNSSGGILFTAHCLDTVAVPVRTVVVVHTVAVLQALELL